MIRRDMLECIYRHCTDQHLSVEGKQISFMTLQVGLAIVGRLKYHREDKEAASQAETTQLVCFAN
jgi:hypothetical protein